MVGLIIALMVLPSSVLSQDDPCENYIMLYDDGRRSTKCSRYYPDSFDRFITEGWSRVQLKSTEEDLTMPTQCIQHGYCGAHSNVWLNGTHPTVEDGIVDRMGCLSMFSSCCMVQYPIQIKNCTDYMVYNLKKTFGSDERYCFGDSTLCYPTTTTVRPSTKITSSADNKHPDGEETPYVHGNRYRVSDCKSDETVTILGVCLSITIILLIVLVLGIFCYLRQRSMSNKLTDFNSPTINPVCSSKYKNTIDHNYDITKPSQYNTNVYETY